MPWTRIESELRQVLAAPDVAEGRKRLIGEALRSLPRVAGLAQPESVKQLMAEHFLALAAPDPAFEPDHNWYGAWMRMVSLRRFPAGQLDYEPDALPRSWIAKVPPRDIPRMLKVVALGLGGFSPCLFTHVAVKRKSRLMTEAESNRSYLRVAHVMELQPRIRGLITSSWFHAEETFRVSPHLKWFNETPAANGAFFSVTGPADESSGVFTRSPERKKLFEEGLFRPQTGLMIWPRRQLLDWARRHPEWDQTR